jgi:dTDP-4-dehydrorhamnose 3,5-epimerase
MAGFERLDTRLDGPIPVQPTVFRDERGFFSETYRRAAYAEVGIPEEFVQHNHSRSGHGVVRGMHFQVGDGMAKLVRCGLGAILDVVVDLRRGSPTFGEWEAVELDDSTHRQLWIPIGFGHGFCVLSETADFVYKCTAYYDPATEAGIKFDDPAVGIEWPQDIELLYSERDRTAPTLAEVADELPFRYEP